MALLIDFSEKWQTSGFTRRLSSKESSCNAGDTGDMGLILGSGRYPGGWHGNSLQYPCPENPMNRWAWRAVVHKVAKNQIWLKRLSMHTQKRITHMVLSWLQALLRSHITLGLNFKAKTNWSTHYKNSGKNQLLVLYIFTFLKLKAITVMHIIPFFACCSDVFWGSLCAWPQGR